MEYHLCFGVVASILKLCCVQTISTASFVAKMIFCLDKQSSYIKMHPHQDWNDLDPDRAAISKLLHCKTNFNLSNPDLIKSLSPSDVRREFEEHVLLWVNEDKKAEAILAVLDILQKDPDVHDANRDSFQVYMGMDWEKLAKKNIYSFSDFFSRILLYVTCCNLKNQDGKALIGYIQSGYLTELTEKYKYEYRWDQETQKLILVFQQLFDVFEKGLLQYRVLEFITEVDPSNGFDIDHLEQPDSFIHYMNEKLRDEAYLPMKKNSSVTIRYICQFFEMLDAFRTYMSFTHWEIEDGFLMPFFVNRASMLDFREKAYCYRKDLCQIYWELRTRMFFNDVHTKQELTKQ